MRSDFLLGYLMKTWSKFSYSICVNIVTLSLLLLLLLVIFKMFQEP